MASNAVPPILQRYWPFMVVIVLYEIPQSKVAGGDIWRTKKPCYCKMTIDPSCICEMFFLAFSLHVDQYEEVHHLLIQRIMLIGMHNNANDFLYFQYMQINSIYVITPSIGEFWY
ncbi:unnamed protein product [Larinioides sclopetarius]|uniref:LAGLIDADG homing endonuclease n=1 Tax=Larinioides sclopetarius TaxID=280406 RepID=A0AAV2BP05_9ARAC